VHRLTTRVVLARPALPDGMAPARLINHSDLPSTNCTLIIEPSWQALVQSQQRLGHDSTVAPVKLSSGDSETLVREACEAYERGDEEVHCVGSPLRARPQIRRVQVSGLVRDRLLDARQIALHHGDLLRGLCTQESNE